MTASVAIALLDELFSNRPSLFNEFVKRFQSRHFLSKSRLFRMPNIADNQRVATVSEARGEF